MRKLEIRFSLSDEKEEDKKILDLLETEYNKSYFIKSILFKMALGVRITELIGDKREELEQRTPINRNKKEQIGECNSINSEIFDKKSDNKDIQDEFSDFFRK